jgi:predicted PurR-regulated permease PerM
MHTILNKRRAFYIIAAIILILFVFLVIRFRSEAARTLAPFFISIPVVYIVKPLAARLERRRIKKSISILVVYLFFLLAFSAAVFYLIPELINNTRELAVKLPAIMQQYQDLLGGIISKIESSRWSDDMKDMAFRQINALIGQAESFISGMLGKSVGIIVDTATTVINVSVAMFISYYAIKDSDHFSAAFLNLLPRRWRNGAIGLGKEVSSVLSNFIQGQLLTSFILGILEVAAFMALGVKYSLVLGIIGGISNIIPYFGPFLGAIPAVAIAILDSPVKAVWTVAVLFVTQQIDNTLISPKVIEGKLGLHPVATIFAVLAGGELFGIAGMILSVPIFAILKVMLHRAVDAL